jgi:hypothetical protein
MEPRSLASSPRPAVESPGKRHVGTLTHGWVSERKVGKQPVVSVQQWEIAPQLERVAGLRRAVVAYAAAEGVAGGVLADLAIGVSAVVANVVRSSRHVGSRVPVSVSVDVAEDGVLARVHAPQAQTARLDNPGAALGLVIAASLACDIRVDSSGTTETEISMRFPRAAAPRDPMPATASVPHGRLSSAERESV